MVFLLLKFNYYYIFSFFLWNYSGLFLESNYFVTLCGFKERDVRLSDLSERVQFPISKNGGVFTRDFRWWISLPRPSPPTYPFDT